MGDVDLTVAAAADGQQLRLIDAAGHVVGSAVVKFSAPETVDRESIEVCLSACRTCEHLRSITDGRVVAGRALYGVACRLRGCGLLSLQSRCPAGRWPE